MTLTFKEVAEILAIIDASSCEEFVLDLAGVRLEVRRGAGGLAHRVEPPARALGSVRPVSDAPLANRSSPAPPMAPRPARGPPLVAAEGTLQIRAPMVGTFYRRPSPEEPPFVEVGRRVRAGDPIGLIEVMKLFTTIPAPADGVIDAIAIESAGPVEFDQLIMTLRPG